MKQIFYFAFFLIISIAAPSLSAIESGEYVFKLSIGEHSHQIDIHVKSGKDKVIATMIHSSGEPATLEGVIKGNQIILWSRSTFDESKQIVDVHQMVGTIRGRSASGNGCRLQNTKVQEYRWEFIPK